jgi:hypothetical protein
LTFGAELICATFFQSLAWYFSLANIAIEVLGFGINKLAARQSQRSQGKGDPGKAEQENDMETQYQNLEKMKADVDTEVGQYTPTAAP